MRVLLRYLLMPLALVLVSFVATTRDTSAEVNIQAYEASPCELTIIWQADGDSAGDYFGFSVDGGGDINGDGRPDVIVGAMLANRVYFYYDFLGFGLGFYRSGDSGSNFGRSVRFIEDITGDGTDDAAIGAPKHTPMGYDSAGAVLDWDYNLNFSWPGSNTGDKLGYSVANASDVDGDGFDDMFAGAPEADGLVAADMGYALLLSLKLNIVIHQFYGAEAGARFGHAVSGVGDVDGDGLPDVIIGAPMASALGGPPTPRTGAAFVYRVDGTLIRRFEGEGDGDYFGHSVAGAGDVNNDGTPDILIGAPLADVGGNIDAGTAYLYSGADGSLLDRLDGWTSNIHTGYSVRGVGDINADGYDDYIVGSNRDDANSKPDAGAVHVCAGPTGNYLWSIVGDMPDDLFGTAVAPAGDFTGDGRPDFLVGAFSANPGGRVEAGTVYLFGCACNCPCNGDPTCDGATDILDVVNTVNVAFRGGAAVRTGNCPYDDTDVDCSGATDVLDVVKMVNVAFRGADKATEFCSPCL